MDGRTYSVLRAIRRQLGAACHVRCSSSGWSCLGVPPGQPQDHEDSANIPFRHEDKPAGDREWPGAQTRRTGNEHKKDKNQGRIPRATWDGIKEYNNPLPALVAVDLLRLTIVWGIGYTIAYPAWPLVNRRDARAFSASRPGPTWPSISRSSMR
jgi:hypothetical protein